jgi:hypothetical protein
MPGKKEGGDDLSLRARAKKTPEEIAEETKAAIEKGEEEHEAVREEQIAEAAETAKRQAEEEKEDREEEKRKREEAEAGVKKPGGSQSGSKASSPNPPRAPSHPGAHRSE